MDIQYQVRAKIALYAIKAVIIYEINEFYTICILRKPHYDKQLPNWFLIRTTINSALDYLKRIGYIEIIREISLTTPTILNDVIMEKFQLKNLSLYGLSTLNYRDTVVVDDLLDNNVTVKTIILKLNASLDTLGVGADYDVSMKFLSIFPLRIKSRISIAFNNINIHLILIINNRNKNYKIQHLELHWCFSRLNNENEYHLIESINVIDSW
ncbi:uncharacterized protein LOC130444730 [Diorhabda sublineata]|uniref:uncharacterized protein LOC130444730 n=1 Tax=Diorhabda sublineata TaxID=1163346 RepID=UPI0024E11FD0|nr:uncharacterized protein LOC130444730 [Diorhabda sublineata]